MNMEQINQQYEKVAAQIGDAQYKIRQLNALIATLYAQADALNKAAADLAAPKTETSESLKPEESKDEASHV